MPFRVIRQVIRKGEEQSLTTLVASETLRIGRGTDNELILEDLGVSYEHATITAVGSGYHLRDLTGAGLTRVNSVPVQERAVAPGNVIGIGPYELRLGPLEPDDHLTIRVTEQRAPGSGDAVALLPRYALSTSRWSKSALTVVASLAVLGAATWAFGIGKQRIFMPGDVSVKHSLFANDCRMCHVGWKVVWNLVPDKTCLACHSGPPHFKDRSREATPQCASCHVEHKGNAMLAHVPDSRCATCHENLKVKGGEPRFAASVHSFDTDHPEFAVSVMPAEGKPPQRIRLNDPQAPTDYAQLKLNHKLHLAPELSGPTGPEQLTCANCHKPDAQSAYMLPVNYERDCMRCHQLDFDDRLGVKTVPHPQKPDEVRHFLQAAYAEYYLFTHEAELRSRGMVKRVPGAPPTNEEQWVGDMTAKAEQYLYSRKTKKCLLCHTIEFPDVPAAAISMAEGRMKPSRALPVVAKTDVPARWFANMVFDHAPHNALIKQKGCVACHAGAEQSQKTSDVLLPGIKSCRECHFDPGGAGAQCTECHVYHDKTVTRASEHPLDLPVFPRPATESPSSAPPRQTRQGGVE